VLNYNITTVLKNESSKDIERLNKEREKRKKYRESQKNKKANKGGEGKLDKKNEEGKDIKETKVNKKRKEEKSTKPTIYQINSSIALAYVKKRLLKALLYTNIPPKNFCDEVKELMKKNLEAVRPGRKYERKPKHPSKRFPTNLRKVI
jgi:hypothetical protein